VHGVYVDKKVAGQEIGARGASPDAPSDGEVATQPTAITAVASATLM